MSNQGVRQEVNPSQEPEVGAWGGREAAAIRAVGPDSSTVTPGRPQNSDQLSSSDPKTPGKTVVGSKLYQVMKLLTPAPFRSYIQAVS